jgi:hypothetical protein
MVDHRQHEVCGLPGCQRTGALLRSSHMKATLLASLTLPLLLTQCLDPMMHGPQGAYPYGDPNQRLEMRERGTDLNRMAYERGWQDGQMDAQQRQANNYGRHTTRFDRNTVLAYRDGYSQGYTQAHQGSPGGLQWPGAGGARESSATATTAGTARSGLQSGLRLRPAGSHQRPGGRSCGACGALRSALPLQL